MAPKCSPWSDACMHNLTTLSFRLCSNGKEANTQWSQGANQTGGRNFKESQPNIAGFFLPCSGRDISGSIASVQKSQHPSWMVVHINKSSWPLWYVDPVSTLIMILLDWLTFPQGAQALLAPQAGVAGLPSFSLEPSILTRSSPQGGGRFPGAVPGQPRATRAGPAPAPNAGGRLRRETG